MTTQALGMRLRKLREAKKIGLRDLARRAEVSPSFLSELETGRRYPSEDVLERLADELGVTAASLRKLDLRPHLSELRELLAEDPAWGPVFRRIARDGRSGKISPEKLLKRLDGE